MCVVPRFIPYPLPYHHTQTHAVTPLPPNATAPTWPDIDFVSFVSNRPEQVKGGTIRFTALMSVNNFGINDITYCGVSY